MKEYKAVTYLEKISFSIEKKDQNLSEFLNRYAREGWRVIDSKDMIKFILERDKNR